MVALCELFSFVSSFLFSSGFACFWFLLGVGLLQLRAALSLFSFFLFDLLRARVCGSLSSLYGFLFLVILGVVGIFWNWDVWSFLYGDFLVGSFWLSVCVYTCDLLIYLVLSRRSSQ